MNDFNKLNKIYSDDDNIVFDARNTPFSIFGNDDEPKYLLDPSIVYGKDYPSGYVDYDMFRILNLIKASKYDFDEILANIQLESAFSEVQIKETLLENNFITPKDCDVAINVKDRISKMDAAQLSRLLKKHGISASGKKKKLIKLAAQHIPENEFIDDFTITPDGLNFLEEFEWIGLFKWALDEFEFNEFHKYVDEHEGSHIQLALDFIDEHLKKAIRQRDFKYYDCCLRARADTYAFNEYDLKTALCEEIKRMILRLNPILYTYASYYSQYLIFNPENIESIKIYSEELGIDDIKGLYFKIWDSLDLEKEYVSKEDAFKYLERLFEDEDYEEASDEFEAEYFENPEEYYNIAMDYYNNKEYYSATDFFNFTLEMKPEQIDARYYLAQSYYYIEDTESAIEVIDEAIEMKSDDGRFWSVKGACYSTSGNNDKAMEYFNIALKLNPNDPGILRNVGTFHFDNNDFDTALEYFNKACMIDEEDINLILDKVKVFVELEKWDEADKCFEDIHKITGDNYDYLILKGGYLHAKNDFEEAINCFDKAMELSDNPAMIWMSKALVYSDMDDKQKTEECLDEANRLDDMIIPAFIHMLKK